MVNRVSGPRTLWPSRTTETPLCQKKVMPESGVRQWIAIAMKNAMAYHEI